MLSLAQGIEHYVDRLRVLPGVTGLAAINLPPDDSLPECAEKSRFWTWNTFVQPHFGWICEWCWPRRCEMLGVSGEQTMTLMNVRRKVELEQADDKGVALAPAALAAQIRIGSSPGRRAR